MSLTKKDRKVRSDSGITFPAERFAIAIARVLHQQYGATPSAIKTVSALIGANERAVKNWFDGKNAPSGESLVALCRYSNGIFSIVLKLAGRTEHIKVRQVEEATIRIRELLAWLEDEA